MILEPEVQTEPGQQDPAQDLVPDSKPKEILVIAGGGGLALAGSTIEKIIGYLYSLVLIWGLGAESFGLFTLAMAINMLVGMVANLGLVQGVVRYGVIQYRTQGRRAIHQVNMGALQVALPASIVIMLALVWGADWLATLFHKPELAILIRTMGISIPFMTIQSILLASTRALKIMKYSVITWVVQPLTALLLALPVLLFKSSILFVSLAYSGSYIVAACLAAFFYLRLALQKGIHDEEFSLPDMVRFSVPLSFIQWINYANQRTETFFLGFLPSAIDVGVYNIALRLAGLETILIDSLNKIFGPVTSELSHQHEIEKLGSLYKTMAKWALTAALLLFLVYTLFAKRIMGTFDATYIRGTTALIALGVAELVNAITGPCGTVLLMSGRSGLSLMNTVILLGTSILLDWLLIPSYGLAGATVAGLLTIIFVNILRVIEVWVTLKIHPFRWDLLKPIAAALCSFCVTYLLRALLPGGSLFADMLWAGESVLLYIAMIMLLKLDANDRLVLTALRERLIDPMKNGRRTVRGGTARYD